MLEKFVHCTFPEKDTNIDKNVIEFKVLFELPTKFTEIDVANNVGYISYEQTLDGIREQFQVKFH